MKSKPALAYDPDGDDAPAFAPARARIPECGMGGTGGGGEDHFDDAQALSLRVGTCYRFIEDGRHFEAKLAWQSPGGAILIFTDERGERVKVLSTISAQYLAQSGALREVPLLASPAYPLRRRA
ncbi:MAG: hypothetical protein AB1831_12450 [Pseudomonadota bacterium]